MNKPKSLKAIVLSMALTAGMLSSANATAQEADRPGGLFGGGSFFDEFVGLFADNDDQVEENRTAFGFDISTGLFGGNGGDAGGNYGINIGTFGQDPPEETTPLGSGLFIMAAAGAAYAFSRKRKNQENN
jgi:hypothetical protein